MKALLLMLSGTLLGRNEYRKPLKAFTKLKEDRDPVKRFTARYKQQYLPPMAHVRDDFSPQQLQLHSRLRVKCAVRSMEVGQKRFVIRNSEIISKHTYFLN